MTIHWATDEGMITAWIERNGLRVYAASGYSLEIAIGRLVYALSQRDDPEGQPHVEIVEGA